jgi:hypothetical protein
MCWQAFQVLSLLQHAQVFHSKTTGKEHTVVYLLDCHVCGSQYVGESVLTKKTLLPVSQHFVSPGHSLDDFLRSKIYIIDHNPSWKENQRDKRESFWIRELQTLHPERIIVSLYIVFALRLEIQSSRKGLWSHPINWFDPATYVCLSQTSPEFPTSCCCNPFLCSVS